jgi:hypothetical protein
MIRAPTDEDLPYPNKSIRLVMDLHKSERLTLEETEVLNEVILLYLNIRGYYLYEE